MSETNDSHPRKTQPNTPRIDIIDAFRGFALIGVGFVHMFEQYSAAPPIEKITQVAASDTFSQILGGINGMLLTGKFYLLFSFLFGLSFFIQIDRPKQNNESFTGKFIYRLFFLFLFGYVHHLFYRGDILALYAILGALLLIAHRIPTKALIVFAVLLALGLGRFISLAVFGDAMALAGPASPENIAYYDTLQNGSLMNVFTINNIGGFKNVIDFSFGIFGRGYITLALFVLGIILGRSGVFKNLESHTQSIKKTLYWSILAAVVSFALVAFTFSQVEQPPTFTTWLEGVALTFYDLFNLSVGTLYSCAFLLLAIHFKQGKISKALAPYGRMALTNYLLQSLMGSFLYYGWGLNQMGKWPNSIILLAAVTLAAGQVIFSRIWMKHYYYGPCEWLWRVLTLRKMVPLKR